MTRAEVREAVLSLPLTQQEIAKEIGVTYGHLRNVMAKNRGLSKSAQMLLARLCETCADDMGDHPLEATP